MKPKLIIFSDGGLLFACLWYDGETMGMWTREALPWVLEAYKPLAQEEVLEVVTIGNVARAAFDDTKTFQDVVRNVAKRMEAV